MKSISAARSKQKLAHDYSIDSLGQPYLNDKSARSNGGVLYKGSSGNAGMSAEALTGPARPTI